MVVGYYKNLEPPCSGPRGSAGRRHTPWGCGCWTRAVAHQRPLDGETLMAASLVIYHYLGISWQKSWYITILIYLDLSWYIYIYTLTFKTSQWRVVFRVNSSAVHMTFLLAVDWSRDFSAEKSCAPCAVLDCLRQNTVCCFHHFSIFFTPQWSTVFTCFHLFSPVFTGAMVCFDHLSPIAQCRCWGTATIGASLFRREISTVVMA